MKFDNIYQQAMNAVPIPDGLKESIITNERKKRARSVRRLLTVPIVAVLLLMLSVTAIAAATQLMRYGFFVNKNDQTYGTIKQHMPGDDLRVSEENTPDLIACIGIDGTEGYCFQSDLDGEQPNNPEEALEYMKRLEERLAEMKITGEKYVRIIPLYDKDGETVIGEFGISPPADIR